MKVGSVAQLNRAIVTTMVRSLENRLQSRIIKFRLVENNPKCYTVTLDCTVSSHTLFAGLLFVDVWVSDTLDSGDLVHCIVHDDYSTAIQDKVAISIADPKLTQKFAVFVEICLLKLYRKALKSFLLGIFITILLTITAITVLTTVLQGISWLLR